jgi:hypothetical protein
MSVQLAMRFHHGSSIRPFPPFNPTLTSSRLRRRGEGRNGILCFGFNILRCAEGGLQQFFAFDISFAFVRTNIAHGLGMDLLRHG